LRQAIARRLSVIGFALATILLVVAGVVTYGRLVELREANRWVEHTLTVQTSLAQALSLVTDAETGQRGFLLTGQTSYLEPYDAAVTRLPPQLERIRRLTSDNPGQQARVDALERLSRQKLAELSATVATRERGNSREALRVVLSGEGKRVMDEIRATVDAMHAEEAQLLTDRVEAEARHGGRATLTIVSSLALALVLITAAVLTLGAVERARDRERAARTMAEEVAAATAVSEERFQLAAREAEEANRTKDEFLAMLSHELRTPLNSILGWARLLREGQTTPPQRERALVSIERNAQLQTRLIEDLLDVSRIVSGKLTLEVQRVDLAATVETALDLVRPAAESAGIELAVDLGSPIPPLVGDPARLQQIVLNLVSNALKFTERGGRVEIRLQPAGESVELTVRDNGIGIRPDFMPYLFDRFRQGESGARIQGGLGLGLTIARHLAERHGGTIRAASAGEGKGSTFTVRLPVGSVPGGGVTAS
jgi:signal transduction histidine kinase